MQNNADVFKNIKSDNTSIGDFSFSMHQYYDAEYTGKTTGTGGTTENDIKNWFDVNTSGSVSEWLQDNNFTAYLTETNVLYDFTALQASTTSYAYNDWNTIFKPAIRYMIQSGVWKGVTAWSSSYIYNNVASSGIIMSGPNNYWSVREEPETDTDPPTVEWISQTPQPQLGSYNLYATATWFGYKKNDKNFQRRLDYSDEPSS
jgi:hypothetical protein